MAWIVDREAIRRELWRCCDPTFFDRDRTGAFRAVCGVSEILGEKGIGLDFRLRERILPSDLPDPTFLFVVAEQGQST